MQYDCTRNLLNKYITCILMESNTLPKVVDRATRLSHYLLDFAVMMFFLFLYAMIFDGWLGIAPHPDSNGEGSALTTLIFAGLFVLYHLVFEYFFQKTPAKFITKTSVVDKDGGKPSFKALLIRSLSRLIPFEAVSFLVADRGWHDP